MRFSCSRRATSDRIGPPRLRTRRHSNRPVHTATDINFALGKLYKAIAQNRIPPRNASNLAFVGKLLLLSLDKLKSEFNFSYAYDQWIKMYLESKPLSNPACITSGEVPSANSAALDRTDEETEADPSKESAGDQA